MDRGRLCSIGQSANRVGRRPDRLLLRRKLPERGIPVGPGYQVRFAQKIRNEAAMHTAAVGLIDDPQQANDIIESGAADIVLLAREFLRNPYWPVDRRRGTWRSSGSARTVRPSVHRSATEMRVTSRD